MGLDFGAGHSHDAPPPPDNGAAGIGADSTDLTCQVCGVPLYYAGKGRKPKFCDEHKSSRSAGTGARSGSGTVPERELNQALANLDSAYEAMLMPLYMASGDAAELWQIKREKLNASNRTFLSNNRKLVKALNSTGEKTGTVGFVVSHVFAVVPVALIVYRDFTVARNEMAAHRMGSADRQPTSDPIDLGHEFIDVPAWDIGGDPVMPDFGFGAAG